MTKVRIDVDHVSKISLAIQDPTEKLNSQLELEGFSELSMNI
jgi:hypothetical protein